MEVELFQQERVEPGVGHAMHLFGFIVEGKCWSMTFGNTTRFDIVTITEPCLSFQLYRALSIRYIPKSIHPYDKVKDDQKCI